MLTAVEEDPQHDVRTWCLRVYASWLKLRQKMLKVVHLILGSVKYTLRLRCTCIYWQRANTHDQQQQM